MTVEQGAQGLAGPAGLELRQGAGQIGRMERLTEQQSPDQVGDRAQGMAMDASPIAYDIPRASAAAGWSIRTTYNLIAAGKLRARKLGTRTVHKDAPLILNVGGCEIRYSLDLDGECATVWSAEPAREDPVVKTG